MSLDLQSSLTLFHGALRSLRRPQVLRLARSACLVATLGRLILACSQEPRVGESSEAIIYGNDDRLDVYEAPEPFAQLARTTAVALIHPDHLSKNADGTYSVDAPSLGATFGLCDGERFFEQPAAANCSGVLIGEDLVATSGHCLGFGFGTDADCTQTRYVFGYYFSDATRPIVIAENDVYQCAGIVTRAVSARDARCQWDIAIVQLDRPVQGPRPPASIRSDLLNQGEQLAVIGFPAGLPVKVDLGSHVVDPRSAQRDYFTLNSDTFSASSGSGVFDSSGSLVGLFARGGQDFDDAGGCQQSHHTSDISTNGIYEEATDIGAVLSALDASRRGESVQACDTDAKCMLGACTGQPSGASSLTNDAGAHSGRAESPSPAGTIGSCSLTPIRANELGGLLWLCGLLLLVARSRPRGIGRSMSCHIPEAEADDRHLRKLLRKYATDEQTTDLADLLSGRSKTSKAS
jgi:hypothetical protein